MAELMFIIAPLVIFVIFILMIYRAIKQKIEDDKSPILKVEATVIDKRINESTISIPYSDGTSCVHHHCQQHSTKTSYYVTFEFADGEVKEFNVTGQDYSSLVEMDYGYLTYQGSRFEGFEILP